MCFFKKNKAKAIVSVKDYTNALKDVRAKIYTMKTSGSSLIGYDVSRMLIIIDDQLSKLENGYVKFSQADMETVMAYINEKLDTMKGYAVNGEYEKAKTVGACLRLFILNNFIDGVINMSVEEANKNETSALLDDEIEKYKAKIAKLKEEKRRLEALKNQYLEQAKKGGLTAEQEDDLSDKYNEADKESKRLEKEIAKYEGYRDEYIKQRDRNAGYEDIRDGIKVLGDLDGKYKIYTTDDLKSASEELEAARIQHDVESGVEDEYLKQVDHPVQKKEKTRNSALQAAIDEGKKADAIKSQKTDDDKLFAPDEDDLKN